MQNMKGKPFVCATLVALNVIIFLICTFTGNLLYNRGGLSAYEVFFQKEFGRILWAMFLHGGRTHLFNNMLVLFFLGSMLEKELGHGWFGLTYFLSGIGGNLVSLVNKVLCADGSISIGASGAVFGLDGVLLAMALFSRRRLRTVTLPRVLLMILLSLYSGYTGAHIDNAAHIGGLLVGFVMGTVWSGVQRVKSRRNIRNGGCNIEH